MIDSEVANIAFSHLSSLGLTSTNKPTQYKPAATIKSVFTDSSVKVISLNVIEIVISADDYLESLLNELYYGSIRITEQCKNVQSLSNINSQPAWVLVTAYYAAYFMATDLSKASGRFIINLSEDELNSILKISDGIDKNKVKVESNNSYFAIVDHGEFSKEVKLRLTRTGTKPHQMTWSNLYTIIKRIRNMNENRFVYLDLINNILSPDDNGWDSPSRIRNEWNYSNPGFFGKKGTDLGKTFSSIISSSSSTFRWASNNTIKPTQENTPATISYLYHLLLTSHTTLKRKLNF